MAAAVLQTLLVAVAAKCARAEDIQAEVFVDFSTKENAVGVFKTSPTLQVVSNPLLDRKFGLPNGTYISNPIYEAAWNSLKELGADHVRFQPWFPYPHKAVAELEPPQPGKPTSWNFTSMLPQMQDFMANTAAQGHSVVWNIGTIPCWMFWGPTTNHSNCPFPSDPEESDFGYGERGFRPFFFRDKSGKTLAEYYARLMSFLVNGFMVDEHEAVHRGGPAFNFSWRAGHIFEFLNEGEHYYRPQEYVHDYDVTVPAIQSALGKERSPYFMGVGGCHDGFWNWWFMADCTSWLNEYLNHSKHKAADIPLDYASIHYYASASNRSDVNVYTQDFFGSADKWLKKLDEHIATRDRLSPQTKLVLTELGILMIDDQTDIFGEDGGLPDIFFNAAASFLAYTFTHVAMRDIDFACFSQFVGSPPIEKWGIQDMQFPSGSMISWETGLGNAKYWVLKLFLDHLEKGDIIRNTTTRIMRKQVHLKHVRKHMCETIGPWTFNNEVTLTCNDPDARIDRIWADNGLRPEGQCGEYQPNRNCTNALESTAWAAVECLGRRSCTLRKENAIASYLVCPLKEFVPNSTISPFQQVLTVQASCTGDEGGHTSAEYTGDAVFSAAFVSPDGRNKRLLLVNKVQHPVTVKVSTDELGKNGAKAYIVDPQSVSRSSAQGIREETWVPSSPTDASTLVTLQPYAVAIAVMGQSHSVHYSSVPSIVV